METFLLSGILEASKNFARKEGAIEQLELELRTVQADADNCSPGDIQEISEKTLLSVLGGLTQSVDQVFDAITENYKELV